MMLYTAIGFFSQLISHSGCNWRRASLIWATGSALWTRALFMIHRTRPWWPGRLWPYSHPTWVSFLFLSRLIIGWDFFSFPGLFQLIGSYISVKRRWWWHAELVDMERILRGKKGKKDRDFVIADGWPSAKRRANRVKDGKDQNQQPKTNSVSKKGRENQSSF